MANSTSSKLFNPLKVGNSQLNHRVVMAPMTRFRADDDNVQLDYVPEYYAQRACVPGTLIITEATYISQRSIGAASTPGIWSAPQIAKWKEVTKAVHEKGSFIYCQMWALGRAADPEILKSKGERFVSSSAVPMDEKAPVPAQMTEEEIQLTIGDFASAAQSAIEAGFDGVEIHGANGYLIDQFIQDTCNKRTDKWGGSIENRSRFGIEVASAVAKAIGSERTAIRLSPFSPFQAMKMDEPIPQFTHLILALKELKLAYLHLIEPRVSEISDIEGHGEETSDALIEAWGNTSPIVLAGGFKPGVIKTWMETHHTDKDILIAFGRYYIPNPDLAFRIREDVPITPYDRSRFYNPRSKDGYVDYPFSKEFETAIKV